ncbi:MAG: hypothetical protein JAY75_24295 [Candidatus Thiodiazotropha taylori]|nr:hypothetical protein [Candidatus Thiodiazotropha taylori]MCW4264208.1 hypothetical protein [Candidatus Thiodiazotropha endolucinida]MCG8079328.1 hypothetical protein [Candidatus Thiodiazotropha taylori]MCG8117530.1 hypothetical protein [Candidatus Thiodiazotropha taylori]MCW4301824.1 hypothetical protein [Candidatus Thiodiazotropha endolucinida]
MLAKKLTRGSTRILIPSPQKYNRTANQMKSELADVVGGKPVKNNAGEMSMSKNSKQRALVGHFQNLLNVEFDREHYHLSDQS